MSAITRDEFLSRYGDVKVKFESYYKYVFSFSGKLEDGKIISVGLGGNSDDIYREEVSADDERTVSQLQPFMGSVFESGEEVDSFYDY